MEDIAKSIIGLGVVLILLGIALYFGVKLFPSGHVPGDLSFKSGNFSVFFPIGTCIVVSILMTIVMNLFFR